MRGPRHRASPRPLVTAIRTGPFNRTSDNVALCSIGFRPPPFSPASGGRPQRHSPSFRSPSRSGTFSRSAGASVSCRPGHARLPLSSAALASRGRRHPASSLPTAVIARHPCRAGAALSLPSSTSLVRRHPALSLSPHPRRAHPCARGEALPSPSSLSRVNRHPASSSPPSPGPALPCAGGEAPPSKASTPRVNRHPASFSAPSPVAARPWAAGAVENLGKTALFPVDNLFKTVPVYLCPCKVFHRYPQSTNNFSTTTVQFCTCYNHHFVLHLGCVGVVHFWSFPQPRRPLLLREGSLKK